MRSPMVNQLRTGTGSKGLIHLADLYALRAGAPGVRRTGLPRRSPGADAGKRADSAIIAVTHDICEARVRGYRGYLR